MPRVFALVLCALVAAVVAGCGGGGRPSSTSTTSSAVTQTLGTTTASSTSSSRTTSTVSRTTTTRSTHRTRSRSRTTTTPVGPTHAQLGMATCIRNVAQDSSVLTAAERSQLDALCRSAWTGHLTPSAFARAQRKLCVTMVVDSGLAGAAATAAEQTCPQGG